MKKKVTIQDIADALGISRNTVSKAINNSDGLADATRERILQKALEMGYKQFSYFSVLSGNGANPPPSLCFAAEAAGVVNEIALFTTTFLTQSHFASPMLDKLQRDLSQVGYTLNTHRITVEERRQLVLPHTFNRERVAAILCVEMFDRAYDEMVCGLGLPTLFVDGPPKITGESLPSDQLYMENIPAISRFIHDMLHQGKTRIGFLGNYEHCQSFFERYTAFRCAMLLANQPVDEAFIIKSNSIEELTQGLSSLREMPDVFLCANDFVAADAANILRGLGIKVPADVGLCGFDDAPESRFVSLPLTTIHIHTQTMAFSAMQLLMTRIKEPSLDYRIAYTESDLLYRASTNFADEKER